MNRPGRIASRMERIEPFHVMDILARARMMEAKGGDIVHMEIGEPDFVTPEPIIKAGQKALAEGKTHYTPALGLPELRQAIADHYRNRFDIEVSADRVVITPGSSGALQLTMSVLIDPENEVLLTDPGYPCNRHFVQLVSGKPVNLNVNPADNYCPTICQLESAWNDNTRALMLASPSNPTGSVIGCDVMREIHDLVRVRSGMLIVDEIYQGLVYEGENYTALALGDDLAVINSFSKYFGMTGWRLGWAVVPEWMVEPMDRLAQNIFLAAPTPAQYAALVAFDEETVSILEQRKEIYRERRDYLLPALKSLGFEFPVTPQGAFYLYADSSTLAEDSFQFCNDLLTEAGVAVTPGMDFGRHRAKEHVRFACTTSLERLQEGVERIGNHIAQL